MWVIYLEAGVALVVALLIVWFTLPRRAAKEREPQAGKEDARGKDQ